MAYHPRTSIRRVVRSIGSQSETSRPERPFTEHRTIEPVPAGQPSSAEVGGSNLEALPDGGGRDSGGDGNRAWRQSRVVLAEDHKRMSARLTEGADDLEKGRLSVSSPLGKSILGTEEGDEVELALENGRQRKVLIESVKKAAVSRGIENRAEGAAAVA